MRAVGESLAVECATGDNGCVLPGLGVLAIADGQQDVAVGQVDALMAAGVGFEDRFPLVIGFGKREQCEATPLVVRRGIDGVGDAFMAAVFGDSVAEPKRLASGEDDACGGVPLRADVADDKVVPFGHACAAKAVDPRGFGPGAAAVDSLDGEQIAIAVRADFFRLLHGNNYAWRMARHHRPAGLCKVRLLRAGDDGAVLDAVGRLCGE